MTLTLRKSFTAYNESGLDQDPAASGVVIAAPWTIQLDGVKDLWNAGVTDGNVIRATLATWLAADAAGARYRVQIPYDGLTDYHYLDPFWTTNIARHGLALYEADDEAYILEYGQDASALFAYRISGGSATALWSYGATPSGYPQALRLAIYLNLSANAWVLPEAGSPSLPAGRIGFFCDNGFGTLGLQYSEAYALAGGAPLYVGEYTRTVIGVASQYCGVITPSLDIHQELSLSTTDSEPPKNYDVTADPMVWIFDGSPHAAPSITTLDMDGYNIVSAGVINADNFNGEITTSGTKTTVRVVARRDFWVGQSSMDWTATVDNGTPANLSGNVSRGEYPNEGMGWVIGDDRDYELTQLGNLRRSELDIITRVRLRLWVRRGSWLLDLDFGSRLHELYITKGADRRAQLYIIEALQPLIDEGEIEVLEFEEATVLHVEGKLYVRLRVVLPDGNAELITQQIQEAA